MHPSCNYTSTDSLAFGVWKVITNVSDRHGPWNNSKDVLQIFEAATLDGTLLIEGKIKFYASVAVTVAAYLNVQLKKYLE